MDGRGGRARGGQWRRGGGGAQDTGAPGERRGRGRGGHYRGRGKRDHYRGRGRGGADGSARFFSNRGQEEQDDKENLEEEMPDFYSRRKLESNWDRYEESEKEEVSDDIPVSRGTDYHVLLSSAGDSFTQFRFSEEKDWEMDSLVVNQVPAMFVNLEALAQSLQELPLHKRLNLEADLVQVTAPTEIPSVGTIHKLDANGKGGFKPSAPPHVGREPALGGSCSVKPIPGTNLSSQAPTAVISHEDEADEELDHLLGLQKPVTELSLSETRFSAEEASASPEKASGVEERDKVVVDVDQIKTEEAERMQQPAKEMKPQSDSVKKEITEEDLEDWLDSMIS
ncbi:cell death regulator Aven [Salminus brasiliensis]|uniref:cell death regulator Aven n=1 Tax=Salminus brasiliensis TaxID=930266 RepID=UPI003B833C8D